MFSLAVDSYLVDFVTAPLAAKIIEPILRGAVKASVGLTLEERKPTAEAAEEFQDIAADLTRKNATAAKTK